MAAAFALAHCDKLLRWSRMNGNGPVKVCFGSAHFDCDGKALQHFVGAQALHVQAHHLQDRRRRRRRAEYSAAGMARKQNLRAEFLFCWAAIRSRPSPQSWERRADLPSPPCRHTPASWCTGSSWWWGSGTSEWKKSCRSSRSPFPKICWPPLWRRHRFM